MGRGGGGDATEDSGFGRAARSPSGSAAASATATSRVGLFAGIAGAAALLLGGGAYFAMGGGAVDTEIPTGLATTSEPKVVALAVPSAPVAKEVPVVDVKVDDDVKPVVTAPVKHRLTGTERAQIVGLLGSARIALSENRLMSPADDNAYDRYRKVLKLDPGDERAKQGLRDIAARYISLADQAIERSNLSEARDFVSRAKRADPSHPSLAGVQGRLNP